MVKLAHAFKWSFLVVSILTKMGLAVSEPDDLFQKALMKETGERNLEAAITLYQQVVGNPDVGPGVAAEARWRMGQCYEKLGLPRKAELVYRQLLEKPKSVTPALIQRARARLREVAAVNELKPTPNSPGKIVWVKRYARTPLSVFLGPTWLGGASAQSAYGIDLGLRWLFSDVHRNERFYVEGRTMVPIVHATIANQLIQSTINGPTRASLKLNYQIALGLAGELPHGTQREIVPELGAGFELTSSKIQYTNAAFSGEQKESRWRPYIEAGMQLYPEKTLSLLIHARIVQTPYAQAIDAQGVAGSEPFHFPSSQWSLGAVLQMKIGYFREVPELKL